MSFQMGPPVRVPIGRTAHFVDRPCKACSDIKLIPACHSDQTQYLYIHVRIFKLSCSEKVKLLQSVQEYRVLHFLYFSVTRINNFHIFYIFIFFYMLTNDEM